MAQANPTIKCKKCGIAFEPDTKTKGTWPCPICLAKNPNLKRHYRSVADVCILGLIGTIIVAVIEFRNARLNPNLVTNLDLFLSAASAALLLTAIVFVYKSKAPWADRSAKTLLWVIFGLAFGFNVVVPLVVDGVLNIPFVVVYAIVLPYLFWLHVQAGKCTASD